MSDSSSNVNAQPAPKPWYQSRAIIAGIVMIIAAIVRLFGHDLSSDDSAQLTDLLLAVITAVSGVVAIVGRVQATQPISGAAAPSSSSSSSPTSSSSGTSGATSLGTIAWLIGAAFVIVGILTLLPGCSFIQSHEQQFAQTGELLATKAATVAGTAVLSATVDAIDGQAKANYLDSLAQGLRSQTPNLIDLNTIKGLIGIWTPNGGHWQTLGDQLTDAYGAAQGTPAQKLESIAQGLNVAAQTQRDTSVDSSSASSAPSASN